MYDFLIGLRQNVNNNGDKKSEKKVFSILCSGKTEENLLIFLF